MDRSSTFDEEQRTAFFKMFERFGGTPELISQAASDPCLMKDWVAKLEEIIQYRFIHGVYNPAEHVLSNFQEYCKVQGLEDTNRFKGPGAPLYFDPDDPDKVVVLDCTLGTLKETFEFAWAWIASRMGTWRREVSSDPKHLRLLTDDRPNDAKGDGPGFKPWTLRWRIIRRNAPFVRSRDRASYPGCAILFMVAQHPAFLEGLKCGGIWITGLKYREKGQSDWDNSLVLRRLQDETLNLRVVPEAIPLDELESPIFEA